MRTPDTSEAFRESGRSLVTAPPVSASITLTLTPAEASALRLAIQWERDPCLKSITSKLPSQA